MQLDVFQRFTHDAELHDWQVPQQFLDRAGDQRGVGVQRRELVGIVQQRERPESERVRGGPVAGDQQQERDADDLLVGQLTGGD
jgi:hypothetical protein